MQKRLPLLFILLSVIFTIHAQKKVQTIIQKGHGESVKAIVVSADGQYLLSASRDQTIKLWNINSGYEIRTFSGHEHTVNSLSLDPDSKYLASGSADKTARVWDVNSGQQLWKSPKRKQYVTTVAIHPTLTWVAVGGYDRMVDVWDWKKNEKIAEFESNPDHGRGTGVNIAFSPDGNWLAVGQDNRLVQVYDTHEWTEKWKLQPSEGWCGGCGSFVAFSPDSKKLLRANNYAGLDEFDLSNGNKIQQFRAKIDDVMDVRYDTKGDRVVLTTEDSLFIYGKDGGIINAVKPIKVQMNEGLLLGEQELLIAEDHGLVLKYDLKNAHVNGEFSGTLNRRNFGGLAHDLSNYWQHHLAKHIKYKNEQLLIADKWLLRGKMGTKGVLWNLKEGRPTHELTGHQKGVICFDYDDQNKHVFTGDGSGEVIRWDAKTGKEMARYKGLREPVFDVVVSPDGKRLVACGWGGYIIVWDVESGQKLHSLYFEKVSAYEMAFSLNGEYLIIGFLDNKLQLWDIASESLVKEFVGHTDVVTSIAVIDDEYFMTTSKDGKAYKWHMGYGLKKARLAHTRGAIHTQRWHNGQVFTAGTDKIIRLWNTDLTTVEQTFEGHQAEVTALNISADGKRLYSLDLDGVTKTWELKSGKEIYEYVQVTQAEWLIKSPEGFFNGTSGAMKLIHFVKGMKSYSLDQFFDVFYKPKAISDLLSLGTIKHKGHIEELLEKVAPPEVKMAALANDEETEASLYIKVTGNGIQKVDIQHNGKHVLFNNDELKIDSKGDDYVVYRTQLPLVGGHNEFSCRAIGRNGIESALASVSMVSNSNTLGTDCYIVNIGIDEYKNSALNLNYAGADARAFADSISKFSKGIYRNIYTHSLFNQQATKQGIEHLMDSLAQKVSINDVFIFFYAGHGSIVDNHFYFVTHETTQLYAEEKRMARYAISEEEMMVKFQQIKALKQVAVMDACHSGGAVEKLAHRGAMKEKAIAQLSRSSGIHILASAGSEQFATEYANLGHGLFTYCLLQALSGKADGAPADKKVTLFEIKSFLHDQVPSMSMELKGAAQYPFTFSRGHDFPLVIERKE